MTRHKPADPNRAHPGQVVAYIGLGSNLGDCQAMLDRALAELRGEDGLEVAKVSSWYRTKAQGGPADQPEYLNGVAELITTLGADELLSRLLAIEKRMGRKRRERWAPRCIDLDLLLYGREVIKDENLIVPHPLMHEREFVLRGLTEIAPDAKHPLLDLTAKQLWQRLRARTQDTKK